MFLYFIYFLIIKIDIIFFFFDYLIISEKNLLNLIFLKFYFIMKKILKGEMKTLKR